MKHEIGQTLRNTISGEQGICKGYSEYAPELGEPQYYVYIKDAQGKFDRVWWQESHTSAVGQEQA